MAETRISNVIIPAIFQPYMIAQTKVLSAAFSSGIVQTDPRVNPGARSGGETVNMPAWNDLSGSAENLSDSAALSLNNITSYNDVAVVQALGKAYGSNDLAWALSGDDPMRLVADRFAAFWAREFQQRLISTLNGIFASALSGTHLNDISAGASEAVRAINASTTIDTLQFLGDAKDQIAGIVMHSATQAYLAKQQLIAYEPSWNKDSTYPTFLGKRVIVDDSLPVSSGTYTTFFFTNGAFSYAEGTPKTPVEFDRNSLAGYDVMINRRHIILHPNGIKWVGANTISNATTGPTTTHLATGANWTKIAPENKMIGIVALKHKIA